LGPKRLISICRLAVPNLLHQAASAAAAVPVVVVLVVVVAVQAHRQVLAAGVLLP
jgi:hypothetical protein